MANLDSMVRDLTSAIKNIDKQKTSPYDTAATITRIEDGVAYVHIPGGVDETPVKMTMDAKVGDAVQVRVSGGSAWLTGNETAPPTDNTVAYQANAQAITASELAESAQQGANLAAEAAAAAVHSAQEASAAASDAQTSADTAQSAANDALAGLSTVESVVDVVNWFAQHRTASTDTAVDPTKTYYTYDPITGALEKVTPEGTEDPSEEGWYELGEAIANYLATHVAQTNDGLSILNLSGGWRVLISAGGGNYSPGVFIINPSNEVVSSYGPAVTIGKEDESRVYIDYHSLQMIFGDEDPYVWFSDLRGTDGKAELTETFMGDGTTKNFELSSDPITSVESVTVNGSETSSYTIGDVTGHEYPCLKFSSAPGQWATIVIIYKTTDPARVYTLGSRNTLFETGKGSIAEGEGVAAPGVFSHAEGRYTIASGKCAHAEGEGGGELLSPSRASGDYSHAEGFQTVASGNASHAGGSCTIASGDSQTAIGRYNEGNANAAFIIGNGSYYDARSNAFVVTWDGNVEIALDDTAAAGTTDGDLYAAIDALGWDSDVIT